MNKSQIYLDKINYYTRLNESKNTFETEKKIQKYMKKYNNEYHQIGGNNTIKAYLSQMELGKYDKITVKNIKAEINSIDDAKYNTIGKDIIMKIFYSILEVLINIFEIVKNSPNIKKYFDKYELRFYNQASEYMIIYEKSFEKSYLKKYFKNITKNANGGNYELIYTGGMFSDIVNYITEANKASFVEKNVFWRYVFNVIYFDKIQDNNRIQSKEIMLKEFNDNLIFDKKLRMLLLSEELIYDYIDNVYQITKVLNNQVRMDRNYDNSFEVNAIRRINETLINVKAPISDSMMCFDVDKNTNTCTTYVFDAQKLHYDQKQVSYKLK